MAELVFLNHFFHNALASHNDPKGHPGALHVISNSRNMAVDFIELANGYEFHADLPGYTKEEISIDIDNNVLTVEASKTEKSDGESKLGESEKQGKYYFRERSSSKMHRSFRLPLDANKETPELCFTDGVLTIKFAKEEKKQSKKLVIS